MHDAKRCWRKAARCAARPVVLVALSSCRQEGLGAISGQAGNRRAPDRRAIDRCGVVCMCEVCSGQFRDRVVERERERGSTPLFFSLCFTTSLPTGMAPKVGLHLKKLPIMARGWALSGQLHGPGTPVDRAMTDLTAGPRWSLYPGPQRWRTKQIHVPLPRTSPPAVSIGTSGSTPAPPA